VPPPVCPTGQQLNPLTNQCEAIAERNAGACPVCQKVGNPINTGSGNKFEQVTDYRGGGAFPLVFSRTYNSSIANQGASPDSADQVLGPGWTSNISGSHLAVRDYWPMNICTEPNSPFESYLCPFSSQPTIEVTVWREDGSQTLFTYNNNTAPDGTPLVSEQDSIGQLYFGSGGYKYLRNDGYLEVYNSAGVLTAIQDPHGLQQTYAYAYVNINNQLYLQSITVSDPSNRQLILHYDTTTTDAAFGLLTSVTTPAGTITYQYDANRNLQSVKYADNSIVTYEYNDSALLHALTGLKDENGNEYAAWSYDDTTGKAVCSEHAPPGNATSTATTCLNDHNNHVGVDNTSITYNVDGSADVTESTGIARHLTFATVNNVALFTSANRRCPTCGDHSESIGYDSNGHVQTVTDFDNNQTSYNIDSAGIELSRIEANGDATSQRTIATTPYAPTAGPEMGLPSTITESNTAGGQNVLMRTTQWCYNFNGTSCVDSGGLGAVWTQTITDNVNTSFVPHVITYTYSGGLLQSVAGPRIVGGNPVTTMFTYYPNASCPAGTYSNNDLCSITDAMNHVTHITQYWPTGLPETITDPNGVVTTLTYDNRQRLISRAVASGGTTHTTSYSYWSTGDLKQLTKPDCATLNYTYDNAHRLKTITDALGNVVNYVYTTSTVTGTDDVEEQRFDSPSMVHQTFDHHRTRDDVNDRILDKDGMLNTTTYQHDANGNVASIIDAKGNVAYQYFDALNRLQQTKDAKGNYTSYAVDALDHLTGVTSPRGLTNGYSTTYVPDAYGDVLEVDSPDTGTTTYGYDRGGNLTSRTDGKGNWSTNYDQLGRITLTNYRDTTGTIVATTTYTYDQTGSNSFANIGYLTGISDSSGSTTYTYDGWGETYQKVSTIGATGFTVNYRYTNEDLTKIIFAATGDTIQYSYDVAGRVSQVQASSSGVTAYNVASSLGYEPFGPISGLTYGNGLAETRGYDLAYRLTGITIPAVQNWTLGYDADGNVASVTDALNGANSQMLTYDNLNRLLTANGPYGSRSYGTDPVNSWYDADGNRTQMTANGVTTTYSYATNSNRLLSESGGANITFGYNAIGDIDSDGTYHYVYDSTDRYTNLKNLGSTITYDTYTYNALGQRVQKSSSSATLRFIYDEQGHLIAETNGSGVIQRIHAWIGDRPLAWFGGSITATNAKYIHVDQLNTPRIMTSNTGAIGWTWNPDPFGNGAPNAITFGTSYMPRFPGQYADSEAGKNYNYFRDYDPTTGRYMESDPIGLNGGINTYMYAGNNPVYFFDPKGLYLPSIHYQMTTAGAAQAGLTSAQSEVLAQKVRDVDILPGSQDSANAYMHAMCGPGLDTTTCERMFFEYVHHQMQECTLDGLAKAIHAVQDSFARGHSGFQSYAGLLSVSGLHVYYDEFPTETEQKVVPQVTKDLIEEYKKQCSCNL